MKTNEEDNHESHLYIHRAMFPKTISCWFHIKEHEERLAIQKKNAMMQEQMMQEQAMQDGMKPQLKVGGGSPKEAASPLKQAIQETNQQI